jgi:RimJ/RimL family protein N-acetyltransferase
MNFDEIPIPEVRNFSASLEKQAALIAAIQNFPAFETERLRIRPVDLPLGADKEALDVINFHKVLGPPEVHRWIYIFKNGFTIQDALNFLEEAVEMRAAGKAVEMLIEDKRDGKILGEVGAQFDPAHLAADMGYSTVYGAETQGKGYATEAAQAFIQVLCNIGIRHIVLTAAPDNAASGRVISKLGIPQVEGVITVTDADGMPCSRNLFYINVKNWTAKHEQSFHQRNRR